MTQHWKATGPNADAVNGVIERASQITVADAEKLAAAWDDAGGIPWGGTAWNAAQRAAASDPERRAARRDAQHAAWEATWVAGGAALDNAWIAARTAAREATQAAVVRDLISDEDYRELAGPWESVMGPIFKEANK